MPSLYGLTTPIREDALPGLQEPLESLQGNILQGHGRDRSLHLFLRFHQHQQSAVKEWIRRLATQQLTSAHRQLAERQQYRDYGMPGRLFMNFFLSAPGYASLGYHFPQGHIDSGATLFARGMAAAQARLNDPPPGTWEPGYQQDIHAMVLLADDDASFLLRQGRQLLEDITPYATLCAMEHGRALRNAQGYSIEHFGYVDGRSQPLFFQRDIEREQRQNDGITVWDPSAGPDVVLLQDPFGRPGYDSGSYLVFRKLEQNVRAFKAREEELAQALGLSGDDAERAGALVVGRFEDGTPAVLQHAEGQHRPVPNNFTYADDAPGQKCPFQAHIRKVNPRDQASRAYRIARRGITYGLREQEPEDDPSGAALPTGGVGLLFMCFQRHIGQQFEAMQIQANAANRPAPQMPGTDPVIGQPAKGDSGPQRWPAHWGEAREGQTAFDFHGFVTLRGGAYLFAPSMYFLKHLG